MGLRYGHWAMKAENLHSLERAECMMVRWMCVVSLKDRKRSEVLYFLGVQSVAEVVRHGRLRWFGHVEHKSGDDWVSACRNVVVAGVKCAGRGRKTWRECVKKDDTVKLGLHTEWAVFRDMWRGLTSEKTIKKENLTLAEHERNERLKINDDDDEVRDNNKQDYIINVCWNN